MHTFALIRRCVAFALATASLAAIPSAHSQEAGEVVRATRNTSIAVPVFKSRIVEVSAPVKRVSIGNPDIADVLILRSNELYVLGKDIGTTNVMLWDRDDVLVSALSVSVTHDLDGLQRQLTSVIAGEKIQATSAQRNIVLSGQVTSAAKMDAALQIAKGYLEQAATAKDKLMFEQENASGGGKREEGRRGHQPDDRRRSAAGHAAGQGGGSTARCAAQPEHTAQHREQQWRMGHRGR